MPDFEIGHEVVDAALADPQTANLTGDLFTFLVALETLWDGDYPDKCPVLIVRREGPRDGPKARLA